MRIFDGIKYRDMTPEEEAEYLRQQADAPQQEPTLEEKVNALMEFMDLTGHYTAAGVFEVVKAVPQTGDYTDPIRIPDEGLTTEVGAWYYTTDKDLPHEAVQAAFVTPDDFFDRKWFDFVMT